MAEYVYTMSRVSKIVPPKRQILKDISLSFFPGAKIGVLGLNGAGKSTLLRIMAGIDTDIDGEARPQPGLNVGYLPQEPVLDESKTVREIVEEAVSDVAGAMKRLDEVYAAYAEPDADFDALAKEQGELESLIQAKDGHNLENALERAADALRLPEWDAKIEHLSGGERRRVAICRLLLEKPDMLLLDEPTNHLDLWARSALEKIVKDAGMDTGPVLAQAWSPVGNHLPASEWDRRSFIHKSYLALLLVEQLLENGTSILSGLEHIRTTASASPALSYPSLISRFGTLVWERDVVDFTP